MKPKPKATVHTLVMMPEVSCFYDEDGQVIEFLDTRMDSVIVRIFRGGEHDVLIDYSNVKPGDIFIQKYKREYRRYD